MFFFIYFSLFFCLVYSLFILLFFSCFWICIRANTTGHIDGIQCQTIPCVIAHPPRSIIVTRTIVRKRRDSLSAFIQLPKGFFAGGELWIDHIARRKESRGMEQCWTSSHIKSSIFTLWANIIQMLTNRSSELVATWPRMSEWRQRWPEQRLRLRER